MTELSRQTLRECGEALFGASWQTDLARALRISDARRIREWLTEDRSIPPGVWPELVTLMQQRGAALYALCAQIAEAAGAQDVLGRVTLTAGAVAAWREAVPRIVAAARNHGVGESLDIPDERTRVLADGGLLLYVMLPDGSEHGITVPAGHWSWSGSRNQ